MLMVHRCDRAGMDKVACFYADDGLIVARDPSTVQKAINALVAIFERVVLKTNTEKTEAMTFVPGRIRTPLTEEAYQARMSEGAGSRATCARRKWRLDC